MFTTILNKDRLASQPFLSRLNKTMKLLQQVNQRLNDRIQPLSQAFTLFLI
ncbi:hypothetical protein [Terrilactibacillus tamarindi]|nr:hypothetical protein [Terrilactibacillus tamarindi]